MIRILDFDQLAPEAFLNRDLRAEEDVSAPEEAEEPDKGGREAGGSGAAQEDPYAHL